MAGIAAHLRYISKNGRLEIEDDRGVTIRGQQAVHELSQDWRFGGSLIQEDAGEVSRCDAFNIMLSMPRGADPWWFSGRPVVSQGSSWLATSK